MFATNVVLVVLLALNAGTVGYKLCLPSTFPSLSNTKESVPFCWIIVSVEVGGDHLLGVQKQAPG